MNPTGQSQFNQARIEWAIRLKYSPMPRLDMDILQSHLNAFRIGELRNIGKYWEIMLERDAELGTNSDKRKSDASSLDWQIVSDGSPEGDRHAAALQYFYDNLTASKALDQDSTGGADELIYQALSALDNYYSAHEILLRVDNAAAKEVTAEFRHTPIWFFEARRGYLGYLQHIFDLYGVPCVQGEWLTAVNMGWMRSLSLIYLLKWGALGDWAVFNSRYGSGFFDGETDAPYGSNEWNQAAEAMRNMANDGASLHNKGLIMKFLDQPAKNQTPFHPMVEFCDRLYSKCYRGVDLATGSRSAGNSSGGGAGSTGGAKNAVGASVQKEESGIFLLRDARWTTGLFNERIDRPMIRYLFGTEPRAWFALMPPVDQNALEDLQVVQALVPMGLKIALKEIYKRFRWAVPAPDDVCLAAPMVATAPNAAVDGKEKSPESTVQSPQSTKNGVETPPKPAGETPTPQNNGNGHLAGDVVADLQEVKPAGEAAEARDDLDSPIGRGADVRFNPSLNGPVADPDGMTTVRVTAGNGVAGATPYRNGRFAQTPNPGMPNTQVDAASFWSRAGLMPRGADGQQLPAPSLGYALPNSLQRAIDNYHDFSDRGMENSRAARALKARIVAENRRHSLALSNDLASLANEAVLAMNPIIVRLKKIAAIDDPDSRKAALEKLARDFPQLRDAILSDHGFQRNLTEQLLQHFGRQASGGHLEETKS